MAPDHTALPEYERPPVIELVLGLQFEPLTKMGIVHPGLIWQHFRDRYPNVEQQQPLAPSMEQYDSPQARPPRMNIELELAATLPRIWFISGDRTRLLQLQRDRFIFNWRQGASEETYPRFAALRAEFVKELAQFQAALEQEDLGTIQPTQCEISYVNELVNPDNRSQRVDLGRTLTTWASPADSDFPLPPEYVTQEIRYVIPGADGRPTGRLKIALQSVYETKTGHLAYLLHLTAHGAPPEPGVAGVLRFIDVSHDWITRCFTAITTAEMQRVWGRVR